ncbi:MAG: hypothetical protein WAW02_12995 [Sideroxyarcus sp.]
MTTFIRSLIPIYIAAISLGIVLWSLDDVISTSAATFFQLVIVLSSLPFLAGLVVARASNTIRLRHCALAAISISLVTFPVDSLQIYMSSQPGESLPTIASFFVVTLFTAIPQALFGLLGGWVARRVNANS